VLQQTQKTTIEQCVFSFPRNYYLKHAKKIFHLKLHPNSRLLDKMVTESKESEPQHQNVLVILLV